jgi:hypothetical protein
MTDLEDAFARRAAANVPWAKVPLTEHSSGLPVQIRHDCLALAVEAARSSRGGMSIEDIMMVAEIMRRFVQEGKYKNEQ